MYCVTRSVAKVLGDLRVALDDMDANAVGECMDRLLLTPTGKENADHMMGLLDFLETFKADVSLIEVKFKVICRAIFTRRQTATDKPI